MENSNQSAIFFTLNPSLFMRTFIVWKKNSFRNVIKNRFHTAAPSVNKNYMVCQCSNESVLLKFREKNNI